MWSGISNSSSVHFKTHSLNDQYCNAMSSSFSRNTGRSLMTFQWIWKSAWGTLWRDGHSCNSKGSQVCLLRRGHQVLFYSYDIVFEQDSGRERHWSLWLRASWLCITCCSSYRNKSSTPCLCWLVLYTHWDKLMPDWIPWPSGFFPFLIVWTFRTPEGSQTGHMALVAYFLLPLETVGCWTWL